MVKKNKDDFRQCRTGPQIIKTAKRKGAWVENGGRHPKVCTNLGKVPVPVHGSRQEYGPGLLSRIIKQLAKIGLTLLPLVVGLQVFGQVYGGMP